MIPAKKTSNKPPTKRRFKCPPLHRAVTRFGEGRGLTPIKPPAPAPAKAAPAAKAAAPAATKAAPPKNPPQQPPAAKTTKEETSPPTE